MVARFDAVSLFIFVLIPWTLQPHFTVRQSARTDVNRILHCDRVLGRNSVCLRACACHRVGLLCPTLDVVLYQVLRVSEQQCYPVVLPPNSLLNGCVVSVINPHFADSVYLYSVNFCLL